MIALLALIPVVLMVLYTVGVCRAAGRPRAHHPRERIVR
jgi:hypothetical protein